MEGRYAKEGSERETDEFMKPIIVDKEGLIRGKHSHLESYSKLPCNVHVVGFSASSYLSLCCHRQ